MKPKVSWKALSKILETKIEDKTKLIIYSRNDEKKQEDNTDSEQEDNTDSEQEDNTDSEQEDNTDGKQEDKLPEVVQEGVVILATNLAGRGTDLIISEDVEKNGGLHVCLTFLPMNERVDAQNFGRAARQGQRGSGQLIVCARHSGFIENGSSDTIESIKERRQKTQKERLDAVVAYHIPEGEFQDQSFKQAQKLMEDLRKEKYLDEGRGLTVHEAKLDQLSQLWGLQYHLIRTYKQRIYTDQLRQLRRTVANKHLKVKGVYDDRPNQLIAMVAEEAGVPYKMLKQKLLTYIWTKANDTKATFAEIVGEYVQPSEAFFKACSSILNQSIVVINQNGEAQVYRQAGEGIIVLGELSGGKDAPSTIALEKEWVIHDVLDDGNCLFHALGHQMRLHKNPFVNEAKPYVEPPVMAMIASHPFGIQDNGADVSYKHEEPSLHIRLRRKISGMTSKVGDNEGYDAIGRFVKEFNCVVGVANEKELQLGYTYYYCDAGGEIRTITPDMKNHKVPNETTYRLVATQVEGQAHPHFKSVVQDSFMELEAAILPNVYDTIPSYRGVNEKPFRSGTPSSLLKRYVTLYWDRSNEASWVAQTVRAADQTLTHVAMEEGIELPDGVDEGYQRAVTAYYKGNIDAERSYVDAVIQSFITTSKALFERKEGGRSEANERGIILSTPMLIQVMNQLSMSEWVDRLTQIMGAEPQYRHAAYYGHACKLVNEGGVNYKERAMEALTKVERHLNQINAPWFAIGNVLRPQPGTSLSKQVGGRISFIQRVMDSVEHNINQINTCSSEHSLKVKVEGFDFEQLGVLTEDVMACRMNGVAALMELEQVPPKPTFRELLGLAVMGVLQGLAGAALTMCGCVNIGISLISESVSDLWLAIDSAIHDKAIDWGGYLKSKAISIMMAVGSAAWSALSEGAKAAQEAAKGAVKEGAKEGIKGAVDTVQKSFKENFSKSFWGEATKTVKDKATGILTQVPMTQGDLVWKSIIATGKAVGTQIVNAGVAEIRHGVINSFEEKIEASARSKMTTLFEEPGFKAEVSQLYRFDVATRSHWKMEATVSQQMGDWQGKNNREMIKMLKDVAKTLSGSDARSTTLSTTLVSAGAELGVGVYNLTVADEFMSNYIKELQTRVHEQAKAIVNIAGVTEALLKMDKKTVAEWVSGLKDKGVIVGDKPYQVQSKPDGDGVNPNREEALTRLLEVTTAVLSAEKREPISERNVKAHHLYVFGSRIIDVAHGIKDGQNQKNWEKHLTDSMKGELHAGVGAQSQALGQSAVMSGASAFAEVCVDKYNNHRLTELDAKKAAGGTLTTAENDERSERQGAEYARLDHAHRKGLFGLSDEEAAKYMAYNEAHKAGIAQQKARYDAHIQAEVDKHHAKAAQAAAEGRAKDAAIAAQRAAAEAAKKKPEPQPGTLPAVASAKAPEGVDLEIPSGAVIPGMAATNPLDAMRALMADPKTTHEVADRIKVREDLIRQLDAVHHLSEAEKQEHRDMYDKSYKLVDVGSRVKAETGSQWLACVAGAGAVANEELWKPLGKVLEPVVKGVTMGAPVARLAVEVMGQGVHWIEGIVGGELTKLTGSKTFGDTVAPSATQGLLAVAPKVPLAVRTTGAAVKTATKAAAAVLETPLSMVKQLEITRQPGTMSMAGIGSLKIGTKAPPTTTALEIAAGKTPAPVVSEGAVTSGEATLNPKNVTTHQLHLKELRAADIETRIETLLNKPGKVVAGGEHPRPLWDIDRVLQEYGGQSSDWVKMSSNGTVDGIEFHWIENITTGQRIEMKNIIDEGYLPFLLKRKEGKL